MLGQIFGTKDVSRTVAASAATQSGLDPSLLKKMLPMLAMMAAGYMAKQEAVPAAPRRAAADGGLLGGLLGGGRAAPQQAGGGSARCSISMATATRWMTSWVWPGN